MKSDAIAIAILLICFSGLGFLIWSHYYKMDTIPPGTDIIYKSTESTGLYGQSEYYLFSNNGHRYKVTQGYFDSQITIPRE